MAKKLTYFNGVSFTRLSAKSNKYGSKKTCGYDSRKEHRRAVQLRLMQRAGEISNLREQVKFVLIPAQRDAQGRLLERECAYYADFAYTTKEGKEIVEDVKGIRTDVYVIKRKLMLYVHGISITEV